jgi:hypothetical protein
MKRTFGIQDNTYHMAMSFSSVRVLVAAALAAALSCVAGCQREPENATGARVGDKGGNASARKDLLATSGGEFLLQLQHALQKNDREWVIGVTKFPVQVGETGTMLEKSAYVNDYEKVWNAEIVRAVLSETPDHFSSGDQFIVACGEVWFERVKGQQFRITAFDISAYANAGIPLSDCYRARKFVQELQAAVASENRVQVASMLKYPLNFRGQHKTVVLQNQSDTLREYDVVFSRKLRRTIAEQQLWNLLSRSEGVAIGDGLVWITEPSVNGQFKIVSIFEP